ncbi:hypothetical protein RHECNPAF_122100140 [Rhizobium etli CNPAF512]|nr:hypothetical protein RHECNPAF_122100140 [Rhizobium etli CNPAF512]
MGSIWPAPSSRKATKTLSSMWYLPCKIVGSTRLPTRKARCGKRSSETATRCPIGIMRPAIGLRETGRTHSAANGSRADLQVVIAIHRPHFAADWGFLRCSERAVLLAPKARKLPGILDTRIDPRPPAQ